MPHAEDEDRKKPLLQPRLVRALKQRPRLVDFGVRRKALNEVEENIVERRTTDTVARRLSESVSRLAKDSTEPVLRDVAKNSLDRANDTALDKL